MKIAASSTGSSPEARLDGRFGRCPYFVIADVDGTQFESVTNPHVSRGAGAGIQAARMLVKLGVSVVLTGQCGPNAFNTLAESGVWVVTGCSGEVQQEFEKFRADLLGTSGAEDHPTAPRGRSIGKASRKTDGETPGGGQTGRRRGPDGGRGDDDGVERIGPARARSGN